MEFQGRELNVGALWSSLGVPLSEHDDGEFSSLHYCPNPDHDNSRSPAFQVNVRKPICHCFSRCGVQGTYEHAVSVILGISEREARKYIFGYCSGRVARIDVEQIVKGRKREFVSDESALADDRRKLESGKFTYLPKEVRAYLDARGIDSEARGRWQLGYDEEAERLVIPALDHRGVLRFLIRRAVKGYQRPKYLYTAGTSKTDVLFGLLQVGVSSRTLVLVEGSVDAIVRQRHGLPTTATLGSGLSDRQIKLIERHPRDRVYLMFDRDGAGVHNVQDAIEKLPRQRLSVCLYPSGVEDPAEMTETQAVRSIERAIPAHEFASRVRQLTRS